MAGFLGMSRISDWPSGARPKNFREGILWLFPNGQTSLTALSALMKTEKTDDYDYSWFTQVFPEQRGAITAGEIYTDIGLSVAYVSGGAKGDLLYVKVAAAVASEFRAGHEVWLTVTTDLAAAVAAKVVASVQNGASSYVAIKLLEADDNSTNNDLSNADSIQVIGNINPQGGVTPDSISYQPTKFSNLTQIFRTPIEAARTLLRTRNRTGVTYKNLKTLALQLHAVEREWAYHFGVKLETTGDNGQPETTTEGLIPFLQNNLSSQIVDYKRDANFSGKTWLQGGDDWLGDQFELLQRFDDGTGMDNYMIHAGSGAVKFLERLARHNGEFQIIPASNIGFGMKLKSLVNSFGEFPLRTHPLFSRHPALRNALLLFKPKNMVRRVIDDTDFYGNNGKIFAYTGSGKRIDGLNEEYLTEDGFEYHHPQTAMFLTNIGEKNTV